MTDVQDMTEEEYRLYKLRRFAAGLLRRNGWIFSPSKLNAVNSMTVLRCVWQLSSLIRCSRMATSISRIGTTRLREWTACEDCSPNAVP